MGTPKKESQEYSRNDRNLLARVLVCPSYSYYILWGSLSGVPSRILLDGLEGFGFRV